MSGAAAAERALCLGIMILRTEFEVLMALDHSLTAGQRRLAAARLAGPRAYYIPWLRRECLWPRLSRSEAHELMLELGGWSRQACGAHFGDGDAAGVLIWALGLLNHLPAYDTATDEGTVLSRLPLLRPTRQFVEQAQRRPEQDILQAREQAQAWLWRARMTTLQRGAAAMLPGGPLPGLRLTIDGRARYMAAQGAFATIDGDFPAFGKAYAALSEEEWNRMQQIAFSRLHGLNWLCGYAEDWDAVPLAT